MDALHFRLHVVRPTLERLELHSEAAENLVVGTALQESGGLRWLEQLGGGPARGVYQIEPATHDDVWKNFLGYRHKLADTIGALLASAPSRHEQLVTNLAYATAMARVHYLRVPEPLPEAGDVRALARYWKAHYNTALGAGAAADFAANYLRFNA